MFRKSVHLYQPSAPIIFLAMNYMTSIVQIPQIHMFSYITVWMLEVTVPWQRKSIA